MKDLTEISDKVKEGLKISTVETLEEAMKYVFGEKKKDGKKQNTEKKK
jgi:predicted ATP-dependent protease